MRRLRTWSAIILACLLTLGLAGSLTAVLNGPGTAHVHADPNDHTAMYAGGLPGWGDQVLPLEDLEVECAEDGSGCIQAQGLGDAPPARSYTTEQPQDLTIYRTVDALTCHPQHKDTHEIGIFLPVDMSVSQYHAYGPPAPGAATSGCVRWHAQADENFVGRQINQVGLDGTGRRAPVALIHGFTMEVPNPCWQKPCAGPFTGRWLHFSGKLAVFQIAVGSGGEVWYVKQNQASGYQRHLNGHTFGQDRVPFYPTLYQGEGGKSIRGMWSRSDGSLSWNTCGFRSVRRPGDEGVPCVKSSVDVARGAYKGRTVQNPNETLIPQDRYGNRRVPLSYDWVRCLEDQADILQPMTRDGDGANLNPHQWNLAQPAQIRGSQPLSCAYPLNLEAATEFPPQGMIGTANQAPAPEPTGQVPTPSPTAGTIQTATAQVQPVLVPLPVDTIHWWRGAEVLDTPDHRAPDIIQEGVTGGLAYNWGNGAPRADMPADQFTAVFYGTWQGPISQARIRCDDGCRLFVNDVLEYDGWSGSAIPYSTRTISLTHLDPAPVPVRVEYREFSGGARVEVSLVTVPQPPAPEPTATPDLLPQPSPDVPTPEATPEAPGAP